MPASSSPSKRPFKLIVFLLSLFICLGIVLVHKDMLRDLSLDTEFRLDKPSLCLPDRDGNLYVVDRSMMRILKITREGELALSIRGGRTGRDGFYRTRHLAAGDDGALYCVNDVLDKNGIELASESIVRFSPAGKPERTLARHEYGNSDSPRFYGRIKGLQFLDGRLCYTYADHDRIALYRLSDRGEEEIGSFPLRNASRTVLYCRVTPDLQRMYATMRNGELLVHDGSVATTLYRGRATNAGIDEGSVPWDLALDAAGNVYFTDIAAEDIKRLEPSGAVSTVVPRSETLGEDTSGANTYYDRLNVSDDGTTFYTTDQFAVVTNAYGPMEKMESVRYPWPALPVRLALFACAAYVAACLLYALYRWIGYLFRTQLTKMTRKTLSVLLISVVVSAVVATPLVLDYYHTLNRQILNTIASVTYAASQTIDGDRLASIRTLEDFDGPAYRELREQMNHFVEKSYDYDDNLYYSLYKTNGHDVYQVMDYEDTVSPLSVIDELYPGSGFERAAETRQPQLFHNIHDSNGVWTYSIAPVTDSSGGIAGFVEIGRNHFALQQNQRELLVDIILLVLTCVVVVMLCFTEGICFVDALKTRAGSIARLGRQFSPGPEIIRPLTFCLLFATHLESAFLPVYVSDIYTPILGLPEMIGIGIPLSAEVATVGIFALLGGFLEEKFGIRRLLFAGTLISIIGFVLAAAVPNIWVFTLGKLIIGCGMGTIFVSLDTFIAEQKDEETVRKGFVDYYASYFSSINVACIVGGVLAMYMGYRLTYLVGGILMVACLFVISTLMGKNPPPARQAPRPAEESRIGTRRFFLNKRVFSFFFFLYAPYLIASYFLHYFFPMYAHDNGISEGRVAQVFLLNGLAVTYLGTYITPRVVKWFGNAGAAVSGSLLCIGAMLLFVLNPSMEYAVLVIIVMGLADSYSFSTQTSYFNDLPVVRKYGVSKANGIKNVVENVAYSSAPFAFGAALLCGVTAGIGIVTAAFGALTGLFSLSAFKRGREDEPPVPPAQPTAADLADGGR